MVRLSSRGRIARALALTALVATAACSGDVVSPTAAAPEATPSLILGLSKGSALHTGKYRDTSKPNATGRSGSAVLSVRAVLDSLGVTHLTVSSANVRNPGTVAGELAKVQIKAFGPDGASLFTQNHQRPTSGGSYEFLLHGVPPGSRIQVQANVRGIDRNRTDVVTVNATVVRDAELHTDLTPQPDVAPGVPTVITSTITETNGDQGAFAKCVLYVQGVAVDSADVWVDAGDVVTCAFTHTFPRPGDYDVEVVLFQDGTPVASDDATVRVADDNPAPRWTATATDRTLTTMARYDLHWWKPDGSHKEYEQTNGESQRSQTVAIRGSLARATIFPLATVTLAVGSDAAGTLQRETWLGLAAGLPDEFGQTCVAKLVPEQGGHFTLCSADGTTNFGYTRFSGRVTYHSWGFSRTWDAVAGAENFWTWNDHPEYFSGGGRPLDFGSRVTIQLGITDGFGAYEVNAEVPVLQFDNLLSEVPYTCREESPYWLDGGVQTICEGSSERETGWSGEASS